MKLSREELNRLLHPSIPLGDVDRALELRLPSCDDILPLLLEPHLRTPQRLTTLLPAEFRRFLASVDGRPADMETAREIFANAEAAVGLLKARKHLLEAVSEQGEVFAACPHCDQWEADISVVALTAALQAGPWPVTDGLYLALPSLCNPIPSGDRPSEPPAAARIRFELPTSVLGIPAQLSRGELQNADREDGRPLAHAWATFAGPEVAAQPGRTQWRNDVPGFRAMLRLSVALSGHTSTPMSPEEIERMPLVDFYFLDTLHYVTTNADAAARKRAAVACGHCGRHFLPVLPGTAVARERVAG